MKKFSFTLYCLLVLVIFSCPGFSKNQELLQQIGAYNQQFGGESLLIMQKGAIIYEDYARFSGPNRSYFLASGTKSITALLAVALVSDGLLALDDTVAKTIPSWQDNPIKNQITIRQLLQCISGIDAGINGQVPSYNEAITFPMLHKPNQVFSYGPVPFQIFGAVASEILKNQGENIIEYMERRLFKPLDITLKRWRKDEDGNPHLPSGLALSAREWASLGELVRNDGKWNNLELLDSDILAQCFEGSLANPSYGLGWWLPAQAGEINNGAWPQSSLWPSDLIVAAGSGKQRLYISQELELVVVRQSRPFFFSSEARDFCDIEFFTMLLAALP